MPLFLDSEYDKWEYCLFAFLLLATAVLTLIGGMLYFAGQLVA